MGTLSERYDIVLSRCEGLLNIIEKERALAFSLNDRYKKSDDCIKIIGAQWKFSGDKHKSLQVDTERTFHQRYPLAML